MHQPMLQPDKDACPTPPVSPVKVQTGMDRYITITKRLRSPEQNNGKKSIINPPKRYAPSVNPTITTTNRFATLQCDDETPI